MGQEILYCFKCQERVTSADLDSANALRFGNRVACKKCVPDLIAGLSPKEQKELVARVQTPERRGGSGITPRARPAVAPPSTRRTKTSGAVPWWVFAAGGLLIAALVFVVVIKSGTPEPVRETTSKPKAPEESPRERAARESLAKAKAVPSSNLEGQIAAYAEAMKATEGTSHHREAKEMHEGLLDLRRKALVRELSAVEERARLNLQKEEFGAAIAIYEAIRPLHPGAEWKSLVDAKVSDVRKAVDAAYGPVKEKAAAAKTSGAEEELKLIRDRVSRWGMADRLSDLDAHLQSIAPAVKGPPELPWIPLFDGKSLDFLTGAGEGAWEVQNGVITHIKGKNIAAQSKRTFTHGEIRVRWQHRELTDLGFCVRQSATGLCIATWDRIVLRSMEGLDHELILVFKGTRLTATLDGNPQKVEAHGKSPTGHIQFNVRSETAGGMIAIKSVEYREAPEYDGLVGYWTLDALQGDTVADSSGSGNAGKAADNPAPVPGRTGEALQFDGRRSHVSVPSSASLDITGPLTIAAWVKPTAHEGVARGLVEKWDGLPVGKVGYFLRLNGRDQIHFVIGVQTGPDVEIAGQKPVPAGVWTSVAAVFDGTTLKVYSNGALDRSVPCTTKPQTCTAALKIGMAGGGGGHYFPGTVDDVRVYNRALSADEIARLAR
jgi:hypothetical protein